MKHFNILLIILFVVGFSACSGSKQASVSPNSPSQAGSASSRSTGTESGSSSIFKTGASSTKKGSKKAVRSHADLVKEAEERQVENAKRREKEAKLAEKPQYKDPSYFGHKKKPKKRPVGKRKLCKECGIVH